MMKTSQPVRWGILGCGGIARKFIASANVVDSANVVAVASASPNRARGFADENGVGTSYDSYEELLGDPAIDAVYVANTHNFHHQSVCLALQADKAVLCEKPLAVSARQASEMIDLAKARGVFLMEAMWTRFLPAVVQAREWIDEGLIGPVRQVHASFGFKISFSPEHRMVNPELAGGVLLDLGIYPLSMASMIAKGVAPDRIASILKFGETGVDVQDSFLLSYPDGLVAHLSCGIETPGLNSAQIVGESGSVTIPPLFIGARTVELKTPREERVLHFEHREDEGFRFEIEAVNECLQKGETECAIMPLDETLTLARTMDSIRQEWGLTYPGE